MNNEELQKQQLKQLKIISGTYSFPRVIMRGCLTGLFSAVGTTIGFAIVLVVAANFISSIKDWPLIDTILSETKLDVLIENQITSLSGIKEEEPAKPIDAGQKEIKFEDNKIPLKLVPPQYLKYQATTKSTDQDSAYHMVYEGEGPLSGLTVYINEEPKLTKDDAEQKTFDVVVGGVDNEFVGYFPKIKIDDIQTTGPVFVYQTKFASTSIALVGVANSQTPGVAREIFRQVLESIKFE